MNAANEALERVAEAMQWFVSTRSLKLLSVVSSGSFRLAVLKHIAAAEHHSDNRAPFVFLEAPTEEDDDGWDTRSEELLQELAEVRENLKESGLPAMPEWPPLEGKRGLPRFTFELARALAALPAPLEGLVVVLAPTGVRQPQRWTADVQSVLVRPELARARFVVVDLEEPLCVPAAKSLGEAGEAVDARVSDATASLDLSALVKAMASAPAGVRGAQLYGAAGPDVPPPPRPRQKPPLAQEELEKHLAAAGVSPAYARMDVLQRLRVLVFAAASAMKERRSAEAVRQQREARELCLLHRLQREAVTMTLVLGGYTLQGGAEEAALEVFADARRMAEAHKLGDLAVQAQMSVASTLLVLKRPDEAATAYGLAGELGDKAGALLLAIEGFRTCGQLHASRKRDTEATAAWRRALDVADRASPMEKRSSTAPDTARQLAALCRKHGLIAQAESLESLAVTMEAAPLAPAEAEAAATPAASTAGRGAA